MLTQAEKSKKLRQSITLLVVTILCCLPIFYFSIFRISDYVVCRTLISAKLGMGFSPFTIEGYIKNSLTLGMHRDEVKLKLEEIGDIEIIPSKEGINNISSDQINLRLCSHPLNKIIIFVNYLNNGELISVKIQDN